MIVAIIIGMVIKEFKNFSPSCGMKSSILTDNFWAEVTFVEGRFRFTRSKSLSMWSWPCVQLLLRTPLA